MKSKFEKIANIKEQVHFPNVDDWNDNFWPNNYLIYVSSRGIPFAVNANHVQDAIDYVIDYCEEHFPELLFTHKEAKELLRQGEQCIEDYISGGNNCLHLSTYNVRIEEL